jgi:hypothetical protein
MMHAAGDLGLDLPDMTTYGEGKAGVWADRAPWTRFVCS